MANLEKKKKSILKRILKWTGITFLLLLIAIIVIPIFFKDEIKEMVLTEVNKSLLADVELGDFDLTFLSTFPHLSVQLNDTKITGREQFKGVELANIKEINAHVNLWSVMGGDQVEIEAVHIIEPKFDVRIMDDGKANFDIVKPDSLKTEEEISEPSKFKLSLKEYSIEKADIQYDDQQGNLYAKIQQLTHVGKGDLTADIIDFETKTTMDAITYKMDGLNYLTEVKTDATINLLMEFTEKTSKFTLKENEIKLNALTFFIDGFYEMLEKSSNMDIKFNASKATFKELLSLVPSFYKSGYESMIADGSLALNAFVKGEMDDKKMPAWDVKLAIEKGKIKYAGMPGSFQNINVNAGSTFKGGENLDLMTLDVSKFHAEFVGNSIDAFLKMRNPISDPLIKSNIKAKVNLATLGKVMPLEKDESYQGKLNADVNLNGRLSTIEQGRYEDFDANGILQLMDMNYKSAGLKEAVTINEMTFKFSPKEMSLEKLVGKTGVSDFNVDGKIDNYIAYFFRDEKLTGKFNFNSNNLDLDELMNLPAPTNTEEPTPTPPEAVEEAEPFLVPDNVDFLLITKVNNIKYNGIKVQNLTGAVNMKEEVAALNDLNFNAMGGSILMNGSYDTKNHHEPKINFSYVLKNIELKQLADNFMTVGKLAPIAKKTKGRINTSFNMSSSLNKALEPIYSSLNGLGDISSDQITVSGFKPLDKLAETLKMNKLSTQTLQDFKTKFKIEQGKVSVTPFNINLGKIKTNVSGSTSLNQDMDYKMKMMIPKEEIPASIIKAAEQAISKINSAAPMLNVKSLPDFIPLTALIGGTVTDPKIDADLKKAVMEATGNSKDQLINNVKETVKDTAKAIINNKINETKEDLQKKKQEIMDEAGKQADKVKAEGKKAGDQIRAEAQKQADQLMKEAGSNPLKKKTAEVAGNKLKKEADVNAKKLEDEANKKADKILADAKERADNLK